MRLAVDTWAPEYGTAIGTDGVMRAADVPVNVSVEADPADWAPRTPDLDPLDHVCFVDGVRRIDARVWAIDGPESRPALAVSYAAGSVTVNARATVTDCEVRRELFGPAGIPDLGIGSVAYTAHAVAGTEDGDLVAAVQRQMGRLEVEVATRVAQGPDDHLIVVDGPLTGRNHIRGAVGYIKTHRTAYLPPVVAPVVAALASGERTPVFLMQTSWSRYSWYLRLPGAAGHPWAGIVRLEAGAELPVPEVIALADRTTATLPRFASRPHRDPRAPQNLYPISGLESQLKRRLGDPAHLERLLRRAAAAS